MSEPFSDDRRFRSDEDPDRGRFPLDDPDWNLLASDSDEDLRLTALVAQRLSLDWTARYQQISVTVQNRVVILTGTVVDAEVRQLIRDLAWDVPGVFDVCNALKLYGQRRGL